MRQYWIFLLLAALLCTAAIGCGSKGNAVTTPNPTPTPTPTPVPTPTPTPTPGSTPVTTGVVSPLNNNGPFIWLVGPGATTAHLMGSGFASTDTHPVTPSIPLTSAFFASSAEWDIGLGFDTAHYRAGFYALGDCNNAGCANPPAPFAFLADGLGQMGMNADGRFILRGNNKVQLFSSAGLPVGTPFDVGNSSGSVVFFTEPANPPSRPAAVDLAAVANSSAGAVALYDVNNPTAPGHFGSANVTGTVKGLAQLNGFGCAAIPGSDIVTIFPMDLTATGSVSSSAGAVGSKPWAVAMSQVGTETDCVSISASDGTLAWTNAADGSTSGSLSLAGITANGTPGIVAWNSGASAEKIAVFSPQDNLVVFVDSATKTEIRRLTLPSSPASHPVQIMADETSGDDLIIVDANINGGVASSSFMKLAIASGAPVPYSGPNSTSSVLFMDVAVSPVSPTIFGGSLGQASSIPIQ